MATTPKPKYTPADRKRAVTLYLEHGAQYAADQIGCSRGSVYQWVGLNTVQTQKGAERLATAERHTAKRAAIQELLLDKIADIIDRMDQPHIDYRGKDVTKVTFEQAPAEAVRAYATAAAILIDKYRLEVGETTSRHEVTSESDIDREIRRLMGELERQLESPATP